MEMDGGVVEEDILGMQAFGIHLHRMGKLRLGSLGKLPYLGNSKGQTPLHALWQGKGLDKEGVASRTRSRSSQSPTDSPDDQWPLLLVIWQARGSVL